MTAKAMTARVETAVRTAPREMTEIRIGGAHSLIKELRLPGKPTDL